MEINNQLEEFNELQYLSMQNEVIEGPIYLTVAKVCIPRQAYIGPKGGTCTCNSSGTGWSGDCG